MTVKAKKLDEAGFQVGGGASGVSSIPDPVDTKLQARRGDKLDSGDKIADKVKTVTPQNGGDATAERNRASVAMKGDPKTVTTQAQESLDKIKELFAGEELSEDFITKAATVFEAAVNERVDTIKEELETEYNQKVEVAYADLHESLVTQVDEYLNYVVEKWMEDNKLIAEQGIKTEVAEQFMAGLKALFEENNIDIPEDKVDVVEELVARIDELEEKLNVTIQENINLKKETGSDEEDEELETVMAEATSDLTEDQKSRFERLVEGIEYTDQEDLKKKFSIVKEKFFDKQSVTTAKTLTEQEEAGGEVESPESTPVSEVSRYVAAISRTVKK